jgi:RNA polymerase sigma factor (TIGR02999 family)
MAAFKAGEVSELLRAWKESDESALERITPLVYEELRRLARRYMRRERAGHTLQTTALVNQAYLRLAGARDPDLRNRVHFFAVCARIMRRILVNAARDRAAAKRGAAPPRPITPRQ